MEEKAPPLTPPQEEATTVTPGEPRPSELEAPAAPRPGFTRQYPVFGYE